MTSQPLKVLFVTPEVDPFVKVGGLADMCGSLPPVLAAEGHDVRLVCPLYGAVKRLGAWEALPDPLGVDVGSFAHWARTWRVTLPGQRVGYYFLEHEAFFGRHEVYAGPWGSHGDNDLRFTFLCRGALALCQQLDWIPDVIHVHDWTAGLLPVMLNTTLRGTPLGNAATVFTIHNLEHQGYADRRVVDFARLPWSEFRSDSAESMGAVNMMKAGLYHATKLTTVSPTYAGEVRTPSGGFGLDHVLQFRAADLVGILNGIDTAAWNPATDPLLPARYSAEDLSGKTTCKLALQQQLGLTVDSHVALYGVVSRFATQKGLDLLAETAARVLDTMHVQFAVLGSGDGAIEGVLRDVARRHPGRFGLRVGYDNALSHLIQAGSDFFVMPSRFEPCGLTQMYAMRYGTPPVVRSTGGLVDTVDQYDEATGAGTGFRFSEASAHALYYAIGWACATYYDRPDHMVALRRAGMARDFGWDASAASYLSVYRWAIAARRGEKEEATAEPTLAAAASATDDA